MFCMSQPLERAISRFRRSPADGVREEQLHLSPEGFRVFVETRVRSLERDIGELKTRLNGLIFVVIGAVITQLLLKVVQ
jgi:hypothetical protein